MKNKIKNIGMSFCSFVALGIHPSIFKEVYSKISTISFDDVYPVLKMGILGSFILFLLLFHVYSREKVKKNWIVSFLSTLFSFFMVFGCSYKEYGNASLVFGSFCLFLFSLLLFLGYYFLFQYALSYLFEKINKKKMKDSTNKVMLFFKKHSFLLSLLFILFCWLPYIISFYPIILSPDPSYQIKQFFGIRTKYADYAILLDENVVLTNHHPVMHTLLLGGCLKLGGMLVNDNFGLFLYSFIQIAVLSMTLAYTIHYMLKNVHVSNKFAFLVLLIYALVPMFPMYALSGVKDVLFSSFVVLYILLIHRIIRKQGECFKIYHYVMMVLLLLLVILFRNNGLYVLLLSFPFVILAVRKKWKPFLLVFLITLGLSTCYSKVLLPAFKITPGSIREVLSIPFQQTARYVKYYSDELSEEDIAIIDKVLVYEDLAERYNPELSDPVKNKFNKYTTTEDLKKYFGVWLKGLFKHPGSYINATIQNVYGYFYPEKTSWYVYYNFDKRITNDGFDYHYNSLEEERENLSRFAVLFPLLLGIGLLSNIGFSTWIVFVLVGYVVYKKRYKDVVLYLPALISILICIASPANTYFRYALPFIFSLPLMISFAFEKEKIET